jgi:hypothetical protein
MLINEWKDNAKFIRDSGASSARKIEYGSETKPDNEKSNPSD